MSYKKQVKRLPSGLWAVINEQGVVDVYTDEEYKHKNWWDTVTQKYLNF